MGSSALILAILAPAWSREHVPLVSQLLAESSRSTEFLHSRYKVGHPKDQLPYTPIYDSDGLPARAKATQINDNILSDVDRLPEILKSPLQVAWQQDLPAPNRIAKTGHDKHGLLPGVFKGQVHFAPRDQIKASMEAAREIQGDLDLLPEILKGSQSHLQSRQNRVRQMVQALKNLQLDSSRHQQQVKGSRHTSHNWLLRTSQALLGVASSIYKRNAQPEDGSKGTREVADANANSGEGGNKTSDDKMALPVPVDDSKYGESTMQGWIRTACVIFGIALLCAAIVVYGLVPLALTIVKPYRPRNDDEAKQHMEELMTQRTDLDNQMLDMDKEMEELMKEIEEEKERIAKDLSSETDSESDVEDKAEDKGKEDTEAQQGAEQAGTAAGPGLSAASIFATSRAAAKLAAKRKKKQRRSGPVLLPDGTYAVPDEVEQAMKSKLAQVTEVLNPLLARRQEIEQKMRERKAEVTQKAREHIIEEIQTATRTVAEAAEPKEEDTLELNAADLPPVALLLAGLCVPMQLGSLWLTCVANLSVKGVLGLLSASALLLNYSTPCWTLTDDLSSVGEELEKVQLVQNAWIYPWMQIDTISLAFQIIMNVAIICIVSKTLKEVEEIGDKAMEGPQPEGAIETLRATMDNLLAGCGKTMVVYDSIVGGWTFWLLSFLVFFDFCWQIYGLTFFLSTPSTYCDATFMRIVFRIRCTTFLLMLSYHFIVLVNAGGTLIIRNESFTEALVERAHDLDEDFSPSWLPIVTILVRAFLVRDQSDLDKMQLKILRSQKRQVDEKHREMLSQDEALASKEEGLQEKVTILNQPVEDATTVHFIEDEREKLKLLLDKAENLLRMIQANQIIKDQVANREKEAEISRTTIIQGSQREQPVSRQQKPTGSEEPEEPGEPSGSYQSSQTL